MDSANTDIGIPIGAPCWMDLVTSDVETSVAFYTQLFGWDCKADPNPEMNGYQYFEKDGKAVGGCMKNDAEWNTADNWSIFLKTPDVRATAAAVEAHGGTILMAPMDVEPNGSFLIAKDVGGATISAWQPGTEIGFGMFYEEGAPVHFELQTNDFEKTVQFYKDVFGWDTKVMVDEPHFRYRTFDTIDRPYAGIMDVSMFPPDAMPVKWSVYIGVADIDASVKHAESLGGTCVQGPDDTPYGKLASIADPTGAVVKMRA